MKYNPIVKVLGLLLLFVLMGAALVGCVDPQDGGENSNNNRALIASLTQYLEDFTTDYDLQPTSIAIKINEIKEGKQPLQVSIDPSDSYFVCGYYHTSHEIEASVYCCASKYTWVMFENTDEIQEYYNDLKMIVAFQVNRSASVSNLLQSDNAVPQLEHFQRFQPAFREGINTNPALVFHQTFIYLNTLHADTVYFSSSSYDHSRSTLPCIKKDGQLYITAELYHTNKNGVRSQVNLNNEFGSYYKDLTSLMEEQKHIVTDDKGNEICFGLFEVQSLVQNILKK